MTVSLRVSQEGGLSWGWFHRRAVCLRGGFTGGMSVLGVVSQEGGLS